MHVTAGESESILHSGRRGWRRRQSREQQERRLSDRGSGIPAYSAGPETLNLCSREKSASICEKEDPNLGVKLRVIFAIFHGNSFSAASSAYLLPATDNRRDREREFAGKTQASDPPVNQTRGTRESSL